MITLYHLEISHYSEKVRWALDLKGVAHERHAMVPGLHRLQAPRIAGSKTLPALVDTATGVREAESSGILRYLDRLVPEPQLYPHDASGQARVLEMEKYIDENVGTSVRSFSYGFLAKTPRALRQRWSIGLSGGQRLALWLVMPIVRVGLKRTYSLSDENSLRQRDLIWKACDRLEEWLAESGDGYLHSGGFTAADLAAAALFGPLLRPQGSPWWAAREQTDAAGVPHLLAQTRSEFAARQAGRFVQQMWQQHRPVTVDISFDDTP